MKVKYIGKEKLNFIQKGNDIDLIPNKEYEVINIERDWYRIVDESGEDYIYPPELFEVIEE